MPINFYEPGGGGRLSKPNMVWETRMKCEKAGMDEGIMPMKSLRAGWRRETFQTQHPMPNYS